MLIKIVDWSFGGLGNDRLWQVGVVWFVIEFFVKYGR